jgi:DNA-directed RNA polymerase specialized sigma24 family protein
VGETERKEFETFVHDVEPRLRRALIASLGFERGRDATAEALLWAWQNFNRARELNNKVAFLYRVGQSKSRSRKTPLVFERSTSHDPLYDPGLAPALEALTEHQRMTVVLINGFDWKLREVAELMSVSVSTVQTHLERAMQILRSKLEVVEND